MKCVALCLLLVACREAGTIEVQPNAELAACIDRTQATKVSATFILDGDCGVDDTACGCAAGSCETCATGCTQECVDGCSLSEDIPFDPPSPGTYAVILRYTKEENTNDVLQAVVCFKVTVDSDGTQSKTIVAPAPHCDCSPGSASEPLGE
jgi:hypothetical protein